MSKLRVAVVGAKGRIGSEAVRAVEAAADLELVAALGRGDKLETLADQGVQVAVELTTPGRSWATSTSVYGTASTPSSGRPAGPRTASRSCAPPSPRPRRPECSSRLTSPSAPSSP